MAYEEGRNQEGETTNSDNVIFDFSFSLIKQNSEFSILYKHSVSLSMLLSSLFVIAHCSPFSLHTLQGITMTCVFKPGKAAAAGRKLFALRFLFLSSPYVPLKLSDFFLFVSLISLLHTIFMRMITRQCNSYFWNIFLASWRESPKRLKTFDGRREIWYAISYYLVMQ